MRRGSAPAGGCGGGVGAGAGSAAIACLLSSVLVAAGCASDSGGSERDESRFGPVRGGADASPGDASAPPTPSSPDAAMDATLAPPPGDADDDASAPEDAGVDAGPPPCLDPEADSDGDGAPDCEDACPMDDNKTRPGPCGCGMTDTDVDRDGVLDCDDECPEDGDYAVRTGCGCAPDCNPASGCQMPGTSACSWDHRIPLTIDAGDVSGDLSDFPVLIHLGASAGITGADVTAVFDELGAEARKLSLRLGDESAELFVEVERWDATAREAWLWARVPTVTAASDTELLLYYDADQADNGPVDATGAGNAENVWDADTLAVWHLEQDAAGTGNSGLYLNSAQAAFHGDDEVSDAGKAGQVGRGQGFDGSNDYVQFASSGSCLVGDDSWTLSLWLSPSGSSADQDRIFLQGTGACAGRQIMALWMDDGATGHVELQTATDGASGAPVIATGGGIPENAWSHVVWTFDGTTHLAYVNGRASSGTVEGTNNGIGGVAYLGRRDSGNYWDGGLDEVRVADVARSAAWVLASYESERDHLITFGAPEAP